MCNDFIPFIPEKATEQQETKELQKYKSLAVRCVLQGPLFSWWKYVLDQSR